MTKRNAGGEGTSSALPRPRPARRLTWRVWLRVAGILMALITFFASFSHGWQAEALPQGCPPQSSVCNPVGLALMAGDIYAGYENWTPETAVVAPGAVVATTSTVTTGTRARVPTSRAGAIINFLAVAVTLGSMLPGLFEWGDDAPEELTMEPGLESGWVDGINWSTTESYAYGYKSRTLEWRILSAPAYGENGSVTYQTRCIAESGTGSGTLQSIKALRVNGSSSSSLFIHGTCGYVGTYPGGYWVPGDWETYTVALDYELRTIEGSNLTWRPVGHPSGQEPGTEPNGGTVTSTIQCGTNSGDLHYVSESLFTTFLPGTEFEYPSPECPAGEVVFGYGVTWTTSEGVEDIVPWTTTPEWVHDVPTEYPGCLPGTACELTLWRVTGPGPEYCGVAGVGCQDWYQDPNNTENYECRYGPYVVDLGYCNVFRNPGRLTPNTPTAEDPLNGTRASNGAAPDTGLDVGLTEYVHDPAPDPTPFPYAPSDSPAGECFPTGWGIFNPVEWVYRPVSCALAWAFVPRPQTVTDMITTTRTDLSADPMIGTVFETTDLALNYEPPTAGTCPGMPNFGRPEDGVTIQLPCDPRSMYGSDWDIFYAAMTGWLLATTAGTVFLIVRAYVTSKAPD